MDREIIVIFIVTAAGTFIGVLAFLFFARIASPLFFRRLLQGFLGQALNRFLKDDYEENLLELWSMVQRISVRNIAEINLRSESGKVIQRPMGTSRYFSGFEKLMFVPAQMSKLPLEDSVPVDMQVELGPGAKQPLKLEIPLLIAGMGYGVALSEKVKIALARGAREAGTAICSGEGPFLAEEYEEAGKYIWQIGRSEWGRNSQAIALADMVEVQVGQGARVGGWRYSPVKIRGRASQLMGLSPVEAGKSFAVVPSIHSPWDWPGYVQRLRRESGGKPIALKLMAGGRLESDLAVAVAAGFDVYVIDGAQAGSGSASPIMEDDFGIPTLQALVRAVRYLQEQGVRQEVSLVVSGGFFTPGDCLKALALGADAVYLGTTALLASVHGQLEKVLPWEPPKTLVDYHSKYKNRFNPDLAAVSVNRLLQSMTKEMEEGVRGLGKASIAELGRHDLVALDEATAELTGVALV